MLKFPPGRAKKYYEQCQAPDCTELDRLAALHEVKTGEADYLASCETYTLWNDGREEDGTSENAHGCWDLFAHVE